MTQNNRSNGLYFYGIVIVLIVVNYLLGSTAYPLFDLDEGAYAEVAREMVATGNYLSTTVNGLAFYDKPALMYWVQALSLQLVGNSEFAYRLPSVIALMGWLWLIFNFCQRYFDLKTAQYAVLVALSSMGVSVLFKAAIPDALLNLFITGTLFRVYAFLKDEKSSHLFWAYGFMALGVLTKGPIAIVIPFFTVILYLLANKKIAPLWKMSFYWQGWLLFLVISLPWYIIQYISFGDAFIEGFFGKHNVGRFMHAMEGHTGGPLFYVGALLMLSLPFTAALVRSFMGLKSALSQNTLQLLWIWFAVVFIFFTISATKLPHYLMYGMTPVWIILAYALKQTKSVFWGILPALFTLVLFLLAPSIVDYLAKSFDDVNIQQLYQNLSQDLPSNFYPVLIGAIVFIIISLFMRALTLQNKVFLAAVLCSVSVTFAFLPLAGNFQQGVVKKAGLYAKKHNIQVVVWGLNMPSFNVYAEKISPLRKPKVGEIVLTQTAKLKSFKQVDYIINHRGIALAKIIR